MVLTKHYGRRQEARKEHGGENCHPQELCGTSNQMEFEIICMFGQPQESFS